MASPMTSPLPFSTSSWSNIFSLLACALVLSMVLPFGNFSHQLHAQNFFIADSGGYHSIAPDGHGGIYVARPGQSNSVYMKHFDASGHLMGDSVTFTQNSLSRNPTIAVRGQYGIALWESGPSASRDILGSVFRTDGTLPHQYLTFNDTTGNAIHRVPDALFLNDTLIVIVWNEVGIENIRRVCGQLLTVSGKRIGANFVVTDQPVYSTKVNAPRIVPQVGSNGFFVLWQDNSSGNYQLYAKKFDAAGTSHGPVLTLWADTAENLVFGYSVAVSPEGNFVVVTSAHKGVPAQIEWRWFNKDGVPLSDIEPLTPLSTLYAAGENIDAAIDENGRVVLVWEQYASDTSWDRKIFGRCYAAKNHLPLGEIFQVSTDTSSHVNWFPHVVATNDRIFVSYLRSATNSPYRIVFFDEVTSVDDGSISHTPVGSYALEQNYPNPFNPSTTLTYAIPQAGFVSVKVYDILGKEVASLVNEHRAAGRYTVPFNAGQLSSGMYFYRIHAGAYSAIRKMQLLK